VDDKTLMTELLDGNESRLAHLFDRYRRPLYRYFFHFSGLREPSEDRVQEAFFWILKHRLSFQPGTPVRPWAYQTARNVHIDYPTRSGTHVASPDGDEDRTIYFRSPKKNPEDQLGWKQEIAMLHHTLALLPVEKREVLILSRFQGMKYEEIAAVLKCETGAMKARVYRARRELGNKFFALRGEKAS